MKLADLDAAALLELAGEASFSRGEAYHRAGRVELILADERGLKAVARGQERYPLSLGLAGSEWRWQCACPAAEGGRFCKHLVAAVLTANQADGGPAGDRRAATAAQPDSLAVFLRAQPAERLADWLLQRADEDPALRDRLRLLQAGDDPERLQEALKRVLGVRGFLDYRRTREFARQLDGPIEALARLLDRHAAALRALCESALRSLFRIYQNSDDSSGLLGERIRTVADLHAAACRMDPPGTALAKPLHDLKRLDDWRMLPLSAYWDALGAVGQRAYSRPVLKAFDALPAGKNASGRFGPNFGVLDRAEELARVSRDFDLLRRILDRDRHEAYGCLRLIEALCEFDRHAEALAEAEQAVRRFPADARLRDALADCLQAAGLDGEALEQRWLLFQDDPTPGRWDDLKAAAGADWPAQRERALADLEKDDGSESLRIQLLMHDDDLPAAIVLAQRSAVLTRVLEALADRLRSAQPEVAGDFYLRVLETESAQLQASGYRHLVALLRRIREVLPVGKADAAIARVRREHARKPKLMGMMDKAGL